MKRIHHHSETAVLASPAPALAAPGNNTSVRQDPAAVRAAFVWSVQYVLPTHDPPSAQRLISNRPIDHAPRSTVRSMLSARLPAALPPAVHVSKGITGRGTITLNNQERTDPWGVDEIGMEQRHPAPQRDEEEDNQDNEDDECDEDDLDDARDDHEDQVVPTEVDVVVKNELTIWDCGDDKHRGANRLRLDIGRKMIVAALEAWNSKPHATKHSFRTILLPFTLVKPNRAHMTRSRRKKQDYKPRTARLAQYESTLTPLALPLQRPHTDDYLQRKSVLDLPTEIWGKIGKPAIEDGKFYTKRNVIQYRIKTTRQREHYRPPIIRVCRVLRQDLLPLWYDSKVRLCVQVLHDNEELDWITLRWRSLCAETRESIICATMSKESESLTRVQRMLGIPHELGPAWKQEVRWGTCRRSSI
ncbi:hypothetical protein DOTSEDRAFT_38155 [Dothistroma septosporum NZE10]|uniref:Uncharacterized protein n=1 Tax=Dothistroma septosporum (strain NZE10 / CBS 128990) TaxID=675120 RepID=N1PFV5_DOTSN|nr:hypothetical protein DOTSEDRAFT_38155 [Dothistroma septosporum NZE10]